MKKLRFGTTIQVSGVILCSLLALRVNGQSSFLNLDFESAQLQPVPVGQYGGYVPFAAALPGWTGYLGGSLATLALQNNAVLGGPEIDILGPAHWNHNIFGPSRIEGQYCVMLQSGNTSASIAQTGTIPLGVQSMQFRLSGVGSGQFLVDFSGNNLPLVLLSPGLEHSLYAVDVSVFANQVGELRFTSSGVVSSGNFVLDSIQFSPVPVPEPSTVVLVGLGGLAWGVRRWRKSRLR